MAASTSHEPQDIPIPSSPPSASEKIAKARKGSKKNGKAKETTDGQRKRSAVAKPPATPNTHPLYEDDPLLHWISLTDSPPSKSPPVFTQDGSYYFALVGSSVKIFATSTGQLVSTLSAPLSATGASSELTSVVLNPQNIFQIVTGSLDGVIRIWDYLDATLIRTLDIAQPIHHICAHEKHQDVIFATVSRPNKQTKKQMEDASSVLRISLKVTDASAQRHLDITPLGKTRFPTGLAISPSGNWLVATAGHKAYVANLLNIKSGFTKYVSPDRINCLSFHPMEDYFATGDLKGNIRLWYCLNEPTTVKVAGLEKKTQTASFHWHAHAVSSLAFTSNGAYLLSGGEESVLVIWQLHSGRKEFVPRLGAPIQTISVTKTLRGEEYLLGLTDATFVFVNASTLIISRSYSRVKLFPSDNTLSPSKSVPLAVHPNSSTFILPSSHPSSIQMFSFTTSKIVSELEISPSNRVSRREEKPIEPSRVERIVISPSGDWMSSIDARQPNEDFSREVYMKIWYRDRKTSLWVLNTRIDNPHGLHEVLALSFSPHLHSGQESYLVTTGGDGTVKTWRLRFDRDKGREGFWVARSSVSFRNEIPSHVSWSPDGSLLAVTLGAYVSLYDALTNIHRTTFTSPECSCVYTAHFIGQGRFLAVQGKLELVLWDTVSCSVRWSFTSPYPIYNVVPHPENDTFAIFTSVAPGRSRVHTFSSSTSKPSKSTYLPFTLLNAVWYSSKPTSSLSLVGITHDWRFVLVGDEVKAPEEEGTFATGLQSRSLPKRRTLFQDIFGKSIFHRPKTDDSSAAILQRTTVIADKTMFDVPAYLAPPVDSLFDPLMMGFLKQRPAEQDYIPTEEGFGDEDVGMEVDNAEPTLPPQMAKIEPEEMTSLIAVFQKYSLQTYTPSKPPKMNGIAKVNGIHSKPSPSPAKVPQSTKSKSSKPTDVVSAPLSEPTPSSMVNGVGKKRKNAIDYFE
ncbi:WD40-repeat-containing domain protein [Lentinula aff. detonsa]|uniref:WD40-repeat-containing domain protein n=1 Tax=Lentinula aff. detonsa TaxID=2804958 RepID=A0AA38L5D1_9AGAR|nr:WD40-repeat-containing domain protein [Lentinula aff. detonsa]